MPGAWSSSALGQAFSQILHQFAGQESRRGKARSAALEDLAALLEAKECDRLFEGSDASLRGMPEMLGRVAKALGKYAAPAEELWGVMVYSGVSWSIWGVVVHSGVLWSIVGCRGL